MYHFVSKLRRVLSKGSKGELAKSDGEVYTTRQENTHRFSCHVTCTAYIQVPSNTRHFAPCHFVPISKFANCKFTIVLGHGPTLTLNSNLKGLNPNPKSQIKTLLPNLKSITLCPNPYSLKS